MIVGPWDSLEEGLKMATQFRRWPTNFCRGKSWSKLPTSPNLYIQGDFAWVEWASHTRKNCIRWKANTVFANLCCSPCGPLLVPFSVIFLPFSPFFGSNFLKNVFRGLKPLGLDVSGVAGPVSGHFYGGQGCRFRDIRLFGHYLAIFGSFSFFFMSNLRRKGAIRFLRGSRDCRSMGVEIFTFRSTVLELEAFWLFWR